MTASAGPAMRSRPLLLRTPLTTTAEITTQQARSTEHPPAHSPILTNTSSQRPASRTAPASQGRAAAARQGSSTPAQDRPTHSGAAARSAQQSTNHSSGSSGRRKGGAASSSAATISAASQAGQQQQAQPQPQPQPQALDPTSHPSLAAWQRFFARHQGALTGASQANSRPGSSARKGTAGAAETSSRSRNAAEAAPLKVVQPHAVASEAAHEEAMRRLRKMILTHGIPADDFLTPSGSKYRPITWKLLLGVRSVSAEQYLTLVRHGRSAAYDKIRNDTFRTLATDQGFKRRVHEDKLIRLLNAFVWKHADDHLPMDTPQSIYDFSYVQGMNVLAAPFLYVMPSELEAFYCFSRFIEVCCPLYVQPTLAGVHRGLRLLDICLELADPHLFNYLRSKNLSAEIYAFPSVLTLCACTPPLDQVLQLWDFLLSFGVHLNVLCVVSQLLLMRDDLMHNPSPMRLLRNFPPLEAQPIIGITVTLVRDLPDALYEELVNHTFDPRAVA